MMSHFCCVGSLSLIKYVLDCSVHLEVNVDAILTANVYIKGHYLAHWLGKPRAIKHTELAAGNAQTEPT